MFKHFSPRPLAAALLLLASALAACGGDSPTPPPPPLQVAASGTAQRGSIVTLSATREGQAIPAGNVAWTVTPAAGGEVLSNGQLRLLAAGTLEVRGTFEGSTGTTTLQVTEPPPPPPGALAITATGTLERGRTVQLVVTRDGQAVPAGQVTWTLVPTSGGEILAGGQLRLLAAGSLEVRGAYDGSTGTTTLSVAEPPPLTLSATGRLERGSVIVVNASRGGQGVAPGEVTWSVQPAGAGQVLGNGQIRLLTAGAVEIRAEWDLSTGTLPLTVAVPPTVVFDMSVNGNRDIYSVALDGGDLRRLTEAAATDNDPSVAAGKVLFVSVRDGNSELYTVPLAGGTATRVTTTARAETSPALSPDGTRMAYGYDASGVSRIWTANINGSGGAAFTGNLGFAGSPETAPSWHPTANRLAFVGTGNGSADIWDLAAGGTAAVLAGGDSADVDPAWSPDGSLVAFASTREGDPAIFTVRLSDRLITRLSARAGAEAEPGWTADGRLVYVEFSGGGVTRMVWIDPASPATVHEIPVTGGFPRHPSVVR
ncbi:hypothetical protein [Longimicrobium sp.]|uniref:hypothetical protein n=1 Tax=Longimicrobium sp. TaxID=2029185 RepID=UPI002E37156B|nr:hypothetical protein [Longimicrobium sp.]HEX6037556.1 hypothetical protein [Longimicrobium sp.]